MANIGNLASSFVATAPSPATSGTSLVVTSGTGNNFPAAPFYATLTPAGSLSTFGTSEIVLVTAKSTDTFTITRAQKSTTAKSVTVGWIITNGIYVEDLMSTITFGEVPSGTVNGTNTVFTTAQPFTSIEVFKNGIRMKGAGNDYTITNNTTITFTTAPASGAVLLVNYVMGNQTYLVGSNSLITDEAPSGTINGTNTIFTTSQPYIGASLQVFVNGLKQRRGVDFTETTPSSGTFTLGDAPITGDQVFVCYQFVQSTTANADTVDGYHANSTPTANTIPVLNASGVMPAGTENYNATPFAVAASSSTQVVSNTSGTRIGIDLQNSVIMRTGFSLSSSSIIIPTTGWYWVNGNVMIQDSENFFSVITVNGISTNLVILSFRGTQSTARGWQGATGSTLVPLNTGDTIQLAYENRAFATTINSARLEVMRIG